MSDSLQRAAELWLDISGFVVKLVDLPAECLPLDERWTLFRCGPMDDPTLTARIRSSGKPIADGPFGHGGVVSRRDGERVEMQMHEGICRVTGPSTAELLIHQGETPHRFFAVVNLLLAALAWVLPRHGAVVVHAGGVVLEGRGFLLVGQSGAGKTTWVRLCQQAGATAISDDVVLLDTSSESAELLGSPFRSRDFGCPGPGRWPLAAILLAEHAPEPNLVATPPLLLRARLAANLPWVGGASADSGAGIAQVTERLVARVPARTLRFRPDDSFVSLLREATL